MTPSTSSSDAEMTPKSDYESLNSMTTQESRTSEPDEVDFGDKGRGKELEIQQTDSAPEMIRGGHSPIPSMLMRRRIESEAVRNVPTSVGFVEKRKTLDERENKGKGGKEDSVKRRHVSHEHTNVYTECGRHSDDWLFGGFSVTGAVKKIWQKEGKDSG